MASISDNFNRSDGPLDGDTASGGGTWVAFDNGAALDVVSNELDTEYATVNYASHTARLDGVDFDSDDHEVEIKLISENFASPDYINVGPLARKEDNSTKTFYCVVYRLVASDTNLTKYVSGSYTLLDGTGQDLSANEVLKIKCDGTTISTEIDDVEDLSVTDSSISGSTYIQGGIHCTHGRDFGYNIQFDDFAGADLAAGDLSVSLDTATVDASINNISIVPSAASTTLDSLLLQSLLQDLNVSAGVATLSLDTLSLDIAPADLSVLAGAVTLGVDSLLLQSLLGNINVLAGATSVGTTTLALNIQAGGTTVAVGVATIDLNTLSMNIAVDEASIVAGAASQSLESLLVQSALGNVTISVPANIRLPDKIRLMRTNQIPISQLQL